MAKFRQVAQAFLKREVMEFWGNVVKNYNEDVLDSDFFLFIRDNFGHDAGTKLIESVYATKEVREMETGKKIGDRRHPRSGLPTMRGSTRRVRAESRRCSRTSSGSRRRRTR